jgi:hypothetical protein
MLYTGKVTAIEFLREHVTDASADSSILPYKVLELAEKMENATSNRAMAKAKVAVSAAVQDESGEITLVARVKAAYRRQQGETESPKKKQKKDDDDAELKPLVESYAKHHKSTIDSLKEILRYVMNELYLYMDYPLCLFSSYLLLFLSCNSSTTTIASMAVSCVLI